MLGAPSLAAGQVVVPVMDLLRLGPGLIRDDRRRIGGVEGRLRRLRRQPRHRTTYTPPSYPPASPSPRPRPRRSMAPTPSIQNGRVASKQLVTASRTARGCCITPQPLPGKTSTAEFTIFRRRIS